jgi:Zn-dependent alcohol dehydrogenase
MTAIPHPTDTKVEMSLFDLTLYEKQVRGSLFGSSNPRVDIFKMPTSTTPAEEARRLITAEKLARQCGLRRPATAGTCAAIRF